jgi:hypothetical protein
MSTSVKEDAVAEPALVPTANAPFVTQCRCGRMWNVSMQRGGSGQSGCIRCECGAELVSWSGSVIFNAIPVNPD